MQLSQALQRSLAESLTKLGVFIEAFSCASNELKTQKQEGIVSRHLCVDLCNAHAESASLMLSIKTSHIGTKALIRELIAQVSNNDQIPATTIDTPH